MPDMPDPSDPSAAVTPAIISTLLQVSTATIATQLHRRGIRAVFMADVGPIDPANARFAGPARTLRYIPAREDLDTPDGYADPLHPQRVAIERLSAGDVLVIDARGNRSSGVLGSILTTRIQALGAVALVTDGAVRDSGAIRATGLPTHAGGAAAPLSVHSHHAIDYDLPVACGGVAVYPGDVLVGDEDGVICIPANLAAEVAAAALEQETLEAFITARIADGASLIGTYPPSPEVRAAYEAQRVRDA
jgi:regulator of RNase E activity RraA